jgi:hypothetical protein
VPSKSQLRRRRLCLKLTLSAPTYCRLPSQMVAAAADTAKNGLDAKAMEGPGILGLFLFAARDRWPLRAVFNY